MIIVERKLPIVVSVPHAGLSIPQPLRKKCMLSVHDILMDSDTWSDQLFYYKDMVEKFITTNIARIVIDMNRDKRELPPMNPDGIVKMLSVAGKQVWNTPNGRLSTGEINQLFINYYDRYHYKLYSASRDPKVILGIDCHTMLDVGPNKSGNWEKRPVFCISNGGAPESGEGVSDLITAPPDLLVRLKSLLEDGFRDFVSEDGLPLVSINQPFSGGYITKFHGSNGPIPWIQLEVNRRIYLPKNKVTVIPNEFDLIRMRDIKNRLYQVFTRLIDDFHFSGKHAQ